MTVTKPSESKANESKEYFPISASFVRLSIIKSNFKAILLTDSQSCERKNTPDNFTFIVTEQNIIWKVFRYSASSITEFYSAGRISQKTILFLRFSRKYSDSEEKQQRLETNVILLSKVYNEENFSNDNNIALCIVLTQEKNVLFF